ncbi:hypothetical protein M0R45_030257 [Rubus argutus]|uniref:Leucine-rich repeat-containing N-terminal plant-type domain-containing protein n=1 Tax=Rubus argutus TaxID=59490 RepID=A0AAW1WCM2_RUBAR
MPRIMDLILFSLTPLSELSNPKDEKVLFKIKTTFNNPYALSSWKSDSDCCTDWLCGQIPVGGKLQSFDTTSYFHDQCLGSAPLVHSQVATGE